MATLGAMASVPTEYSSEGPHPLLTPQPGGEDGEGLTMADAASRLMMLRASGGAWTEEALEEIVNASSFGVMTIFWWHPMGGEDGGVWVVDLLIRCSCLLIIISQFLLPINWFISRLVVYDGGVCPATGSLDDRLIMLGITFIYLARSTMWAVTKVNYYQHTFQAIREGLSRLLWAVCPACLRFSLPYCPILLVPPEHEEETSLLPTQASSEGDLHAVGMRYLTDPYDKAAIRRASAKGRKVLDDLNVSLIDRFMDVPYEELIVMLNLWLVFQTESNITDMILNSLSLEFVMLLDDQFKEQYYKTNGKAMQGLETKLAWSLEDPPRLRLFVRDWIDGLSVVMAFFVPVGLVLCCFYMPLCKPRTIDDG